MPDTLSAHPGEDSNGQDRVSAQLVDPTASVESTFGILRENLTEADLDADEADAAQQPDPWKRAHVYTMVAIERDERGLGDAWATFRRAREAAAEIPNGIKRDRMLARIEDAEADSKLRA